MGEVARSIRAAPTITFSKKVEDAASLSLPRLRRLWEAAHTPPAWRPGGLSSTAAAE